MGFVLINCSLCGEEVEIDESEPKKLLNPKRDKKKAPKALHICRGKPKTLSLTEQFKSKPKTTEAPR